MADVHIEGLAELERDLQQFVTQLQRNVLRAALRAGAKVFLEEALRQVPVGKTGALRRSLKVSVRTRRGVPVAYVRAGDKEAWYAHLVEFGTAAHFIKPKNRKSLFFASLARELVEHPGAKKRPFMRPAFDQAAPGAIKAMAAHMRRRIEREGLKLNRTEA
jgi:HK97 gp10 family phage protein